MEEVTKKKAEIFDLIQEQEVLNQKIQELEGKKREKFLELQKLVDVKSS